MKKIIKHCWLRRLRQTSLRPTAPPEQQQQLREQQEQEPEARLP